MKSFFGVLRLSAWAFVLGAVSCAPAQRADAQTPEGNEAHGAQPATGRLQQARAARDAAQALRVPTPPATLDRASALEYVQGPLREWIVDRRALTNTAATAYSEAGVAGTAEEAVAWLEVGELWQRFAEEAEAGIRATIPPEFAADSQMKAAFLGAATDAVRPVFGFATNALQKCVTVAERLGQSDTRRACAERLATLRKTASSASESETKSAPTLETSAPKHPTPDRPKLAASQPRPCVFAGSLEPHRQFDIWQDESARVRAARPDRLDVSALTLPEAPGGAVKATVIWPLEGTYWIDAKTLPVVLRARQELVKNHLWLDVGTPIRAHHVSAGKVQVDRFREWTAGSEPSFSQTMPCSELALAGNVELTPAQGNRYQNASFQGLLALSASPGGPPIAKLQLSKAASFPVLERKQPWRRIAGNADDWDLPFSFDAWTKNTPGGDPGFGMIGLLNVVDATHVSTASLPLFAEANAQSARAKLAPSVWFSAGKVANGFVAIKVQTLWGPKTPEFWVRESELAKGARRLDAQ